MFLYVQVYLVSVTARDVDALEGKDEPTKVWTKVFERQLGGCYVNINQRN